MSLPPSPSHFIWDHTLAAPSLGGALTLRMEAETLLSCTPGAPLRLCERGGVAETPALTRLRNAVFGSSVHPLLRCGNGDACGEDGWPPRQQRESGEFSPHSTERLAELYRERSGPPVLAWSPALVRQADDIIASCDRPVVCIHLRNTAAGLAEESCAQPGSWLPWLEHTAREGRVSLVLVGDDPLLPGFRATPRLLHASGEGFPLELQLALVSRARAFLGMASGVCCAAMFSTTPYVIFKHPRHHSEAMRREVGGGARLPFAGPNQHFWQREAGRDEISKAFSLLIP